MVMVDMLAWLFDVMEMEWRLEMTDQGDGTRHTYISDVGPYRAVEERECDRSDHVGVAVRDHRQQDQW